MSGDEILQHCQPLAKAGSDGQVDDAARGVGHEAAHAGHLADLADVTLSAADGHQVDATIAAHLILNGSLHLLGGMPPDGHRLIVALLLGDQAHLVLLLYLSDASIGLFQQAGLGFGHLQVVDGDSHAGLGGIVEANVLNGIDHLCGALHTQLVIAFRHQILEVLLVQNVITESQLLGQHLVEDDPAHRCVDELAAGPWVAHLDLGLQFHQAEVVGQPGLLEATVDALRGDAAAVFALSPRLDQGKVVAAQDNV